MAILIACMTAVPALAAVVDLASLEAQMSAEDRDAADRATQQALEKTVSFFVTAWTSPKSGFAGTVQPRRTFKTDQGKFCRVFRLEVERRADNGSDERVACREADGTWRVVQ